MISGLNACGIIAAAVAYDEHIICSILCKPGGDDSDAVIVLQKFLHMRSICLLVHNANLQNRVRSKGAMRS